MDLIVEIPVDAAAAEAAIAKLGGAALAKALSLGLAEAGQYAAGQVVLLADERGLKSRSGTLLNSVSCFQAPGDARDGLTVRVGVAADSPAQQYAYLLTAEKKTIVPKEKRALTIPLPANLSGAGLPRYPTVAALEEAFPGRVYRRGRAIGIDVGDDFEAYFALVARVTVEGYDVLEPGVDMAYEDMVAAVQGRVDELLMANG